MPYDAIPAGKKAEQDKSGNWCLVDLDHSNFEDLAIAYDEAKAEIKTLKAEIGKLKKAIKK